jgi:ABC-type multidrug transport system permease subunit
MLHSDTFEKWGYIFLFIGLANKFVRFLLWYRFIPIHFFFSALLRNPIAHWKVYVSHNLSMKFGLIIISIVCAA